MKVLTTSDKLNKQKVDHNSLAQSRLPVWWTKLTHWEFWPFNLFYFPIYIYAAWLMLKARSFFFFSASNPGIENGGMLGESKMKIFDIIPDRYKPETFLLKPGISISEFDHLLQNTNISCPFILKPDIGERGWMVKKISNQAQLITYLGQIKVPFLLQEFINWPLEMGVFYYRLPDEQYGKVTSIVLKEMMTVTGDGHTTVGELLLTNPRSVIAYKEIEKTSGEIFDYVPESGESVEVVPIGNHCLGTTFLNGNHLINDKIHQAFDETAKTYPGFYFGRFDIRCESIDELEKGNFQILELNGCGSEPGHIYHPGYPLFKAYKELIFHLDLMYIIARQNHKKGIPYMSFDEGIRLIKFLRNYNKNKN